MQCHSPGSRGPGPSPPQHHDAALGASRSCGENADCGGGGGRCVMDVVVVVVVVVVGWVFVMTNMSSIKFKFWFTLHFTQRN